MRLTQAQQQLVARALKGEARNGMAMTDVYANRLFKWPTQPFCDIRGSAQHRMAYRLQELGVGRLCYLQPLDVAFFKVTDNPKA